MLAVLLLTATACSASINAAKIVTSARSQIGVTISYDPSYQQMAYPGGDVPAKTGVCADVVVRALREQGMDLQKLMHEDMKRNFDLYPKKWGLTKPDGNIDHRRVPNLMTYFRRKGFALSASTKAEHFTAGDVVAWQLEGGLTHIGIISDRRSAEGTPLVIHNIGRGTQEENVLFKFRVTGHYRVK
ncbi:MAG: DUF1287 domain-containing protein [Pedosphaera sp.]|nr:DUF1287 domain-containing protein [Pedosphaera sp.]